MNGKFEFKIDMDDSVTIKIFCLNLQGNQYKQMFEKDIGRYCEAMYKEHFESIFNHVQSHFKKVIPWKTCLYPKGKNEITNLYLEGQQEYLPPYIPGSEKWKIQLRAYKDDIELGGYNVYAIVRNENSLMNGGK